MAGGWKRGSARIRAETEGGTLERVAVECLEGGVAGVSKRGYGCL